MKEIKNIHFSETSNRGSAEWGAFGGKTEKHPLKFRAEASYSRPRYEAPAHVFGLRHRTQ